MFGATPPRRMTSPSTRNDRDTRCRCSASSCSENLPGKCIRGSVAMEPATSTDTGATYLTRVGHDDGRACRGQDPAARTCSVSDGSAAEGIAAGAAARGVGVVDREPLLLDRVGEVDRGAAEVRSAHTVDDHRDVVQVELEVAVEAALVEEQ